MPAHTNKITPEWPQTNRAETVKINIKKVVQTSETERKDYKRELNKFFANYRAPLHPSKGCTPAELLFNGLTAEGCGKTITRNRCYFKIIHVDLRLQDKETTYSYLEDEDSGDKYPDYDHHFMPEEDRCSRSRSND